MEEHNSSLKMPDSVESEQLPALSKIGRDMLVHDIKGALSAIVGSANIIEQGRIQESPVQIERILAACGTLSSLVRILIDEEDGYVQGDDPEGGIAMAVIINHLRYRWIGEARSAGLDLVVSAEANLPNSVRVPCLDLSRIVGNLVSNAIRHVRSGVIRIGLARSADGGVEIAVFDEGPGLPLNLLNALNSNNPVSQNAMPSRLGLRVVKSLAEKAGCRVSFENLPQRGLAASVLIPAEFCVEGPAADCSETARTKPRLDGIRILLAEDNLTNQMVATQMMRSLGATVLVASDGLEALDVFLRETVDLVVADIEMPRLNGLELIAKIRALGNERSKIPVIALTAYAMKEHRDQILLAGADGLIPKPITGVAALADDLEPHIRPVAPKGARETMVKPPADPVSPEGAIDYHVYKSLCETVGQDLVEELLEKVIGDINASGEALRKGLEARDIEAIRAASHVLISVSGAVGATRLQNASRHLNIQANKRPPPDLADDIHVCLSETKHALAFAQQELDTFH